MPDNFDIQYEGKDGRKHRTVMLHRTVLGSIERFMAILIEHFAGKLPLWLSPVQVRLITIANTFDKYAEKVREKLLENGIRVDVDYKSESMGKKIRDAQIDKIPLAVTIGEKEAKNQTLSIRTLDGKVKFDVKVNDFVEKVLKLINDRKINVYI